VVLRRRADHRRTADVDLLDALVRRRTRRDGLGERVQVHHQQVERLDAQVRQLRDVLRLTQVGQQAGVHPGVERLHPPVQRLREPGHLLDRRHRHAGIRDDASRAARRHDLHAVRVQTRRQLQQTRLVRNPDEGPANRAPLVSHGMLTFRPCTV
jgi:hypothetical protein